MRRTPSLSVDEVARQARRQRDDADEREADEAEAERRVARARPAQVAQRVADRPRDAELQARAGRIRRRDDDPVGSTVVPGAVRRPRVTSPPMASSFLLVVVGRRVELAVLADGERHLAAIAARRREDRREQVRQVDLGVDLRTTWPSRSTRDVEPRARERRLAARRRHATAAETWRRAPALGAASPWPCAAAATRRPEPFRRLRASLRQRAFALPPRPAGSPARCPSCAG